MIKSSKLYFGLSIALTILFILLTACVIFVDVQAIGPENSKIGLASINGFVFDQVGTNTLFYDASSLLGAISFLMPVIFGLTALVQWIKRKKITLVDLDLILLGVIYLITAACYVLFEIFIVNCRPVLEDGALEASYPSSHTLLVVVLIGTAMLQIGKIIQKKWLKATLIAAANLIIDLTVVFRLLSGVHWFTDILGGLLLGSALVFLYRGLYDRLKKPTAETE